MATTIDLSALETACKTVFQADSWLGSVAPIRIATFKAALPSDVNPNRIYTYGYSVGQLPALIVANRVRTPFHQPIGVGGSTFGEDDNEVPMIAFILARKSTEALAIAAVEAAHEQLDRVIKKQRTAAHKWGGYGHTIKNSPRNDLSIISDGDHWIAIAETEWKILVITDIDFT